MNASARSPRLEPHGWQKRAKQAFGGFLAIAGTFLVFEHRIHLLPYLPWLLLLACPLMHIFMHHGHAKHRGSTPSDAHSIASDAAPPP